MVTLRDGVLTDVVLERGRHFLFLTNNIKHVDNAKIKGITVSVYRVGRGGVGDFFATP